LEGLTWTSIQETVQKTVYTLQRSA